MSTGPHAIRGFFAPGTDESLAVKTVTSTMFKAAVNSSEYGTDAAAVESCRRRSIVNANSRKYIGYAAARRLPPCSTPPGTGSTVSCSPTGRRLPSAGPLRWG
jgi:hypothetical protein